MRNKFSIIINFFLIFALLMPNIAIAAVDDSSGYSENDINDYYHSIEVFKNINIFEVSNDVNAVVTRAEFANMLMKFFGMGDVASTIGVSNMFKDLDDCENAAVIELAVKNGLMKGYNDNTFRPNDYILFEDVVRAIIGGLGYDFMVSSKRGDADKNNEYFITANNLHILKGVSSKRGYPITYIELLTIFENALTIDLGKYKLFAGEKQYFVSKGSTVLSEVLKCKLKTGIVTANEFTDLYSESQTMTDHIKIDNTVYKYNVDSSELLGHRVKYYIQNDAGDEKLLYLYNDPNSNDSLLIKSDDIKNYQNRTYHYQDNDKYHYQEIPVGCVVVYNGRTLNKIPEQNTTFNMKPHNGSIEFIDNDNDSQYDVLFIENYETYVVGAINLHEKKVYDKNNPLNNIFFDDISFVVIENMNGTKIDIEKIKINNVLSVLKSIDGKCIKVIVSNVEVKGIINEIGEDTINVDGIEYEISKDCHNVEQIKVGEMNKLYFDKDMKLIYFERLEEIQMAYMINAEVGRGLNGKLTLRILNSSGTVEILKCAKVFYIDGDRYKSHDDGLKKFCIKDPNDDSARNVTPGVITYNINSNGEICKIYTVYTGTKRSECPNERLQAYTTIISTSFTYSLSSTSFKYNKTFLDSKSVVFCIPDNPKTASDEFFSIISTSSLRSGTAYCDGTNNLLTYVLGNNSLAVSCLVMNRNVFSSGSTGVGIVQRISEKIDSEGITYKSINVYNYGALIELYLYNDGNIDINSLDPKSSDTSTSKYRLEIGDIVYYTKNSRLKNDNVISSLLMLYDASEKQYLSENPASLAITASSNYFFGDVYSKKGNLISIVLSGGKLQDINQGTIGIDFDVAKGNYRVENISKASFYQCSSFGNIIEVEKRGTVNDIIDYTSAHEECSKVFIQTASGMANMVYIIN